MLPPVIIIIIIIYLLIFGSNLFRHLYLRFLFLFRSINFKEAQDLRFILDKSNPYFAQLSEAAKKRFIIKCFKFMKSKKFVGMEGLEITDEMIATISATAVQLSFGFKKSNYDFYHTIKIFPETFYSRMFDRHLKGGASVGGVLYFSWKDFKEGYADPSDMYNLGLHEMAHALRMELIYGSKFDKRFANYVDQWVEIALPEFEKMNKGNTGFLRDYAATNIEEFFAVCVEHFFEVPAEFKKHLPDIYNHLCFLLHQDPLNGAYDFRLKDDFAARINVNKSLIPIPKRYTTNYKYNSWHWSFNMIIFGLLIGLSFTLLLAADIIISTSEVVLFFSLCLVLVIQFRSFFYKKGIFLFRHLVLFSFAGVGLILLPVAMTLNLIYDFESEKISYKVVDYKLAVNNERQLLMELQLEDNALRNKSELRQVEIPINANEAPKIDSLQLYVTTGIFGWKNIQSSAIIIYTKE